MNGLPNLNKKFIFCHAWPFERFTTVIKPVLKPTGNEIGTPRKNGEELNSFNYFTKETFCPIYQMKIFFSILTEISLHCEIISFRTPNVYWRRLFSKHIGPFFLEAKKKENRAKIMSERAGWNHVCNDYH
jgi:hypothetical protein